MFCMKCGTKLNDGAKFCPLCGAPQNSAGNAAVPDSESDTVYFGAPGNAAAPAQTQPGEEDTVFMGAAPTENTAYDSESDTVFMGAAPQNNSAFPQSKIPAPVNSRAEKNKRSTSYESSNMGMSTVKKVIIIAGLVIIAALVVYLVFDFMSA